MKDLWERLNDKVPLYLKDIIRIYDLTVVKLNCLNTALVSDKYALIIGIDRFYVEVEYMSKNKDDSFIKYMAGNFFFERFDENDRKNIIAGKGAKECIINDFIIISQGMANKWNNVLEGDKEWIKEYEKSKWFKTSALRDYEQILKKYMS